MPIINSLLPTDADIVDLGQFWFRWNQALKDKPRNLLQTWCIVWQHMAFIQSLRTQNVSSSRKEKQTTREISPGPDSGHNTAWACSDTWWTIRRFPCNSTLITHWGRVKHICVGNLTTIGSDNGLMPGRRQAIICTNAGILLTGPWGRNFSEILIEINIFSFKKMHLKMSSGNWRQFCLSLDVIKHWFDHDHEVQCDEMILKVTLISMNFRPLSH